MIYLSEKLLDSEELFIERCFTKKDDAYYFASEMESDNKYLCVKLINGLNEKRYALEVVRIYLKDNSPTEECIEADEIVRDEKDREHAIHEFFYYLSYEENPQNIMFFEGILDFIKDYIEDAHFYAEGDNLYGEFMELFQLKGKAVEGYYEGNLVLSDITLRNKSTNETIKAFERTNLCSNLYIEEEEDTDWMIEAYLESMSEDDIKEKFKEAWKK